jgi:6-phosphogluconate dehydrogenase
LAFTTERHETTHEFVSGLGSRPGPNKGVVEAGRHPGPHQGLRYARSFRQQPRVSSTSHDHGQGGAPVDAVIDQLKPLLSKGDIIIDGGQCRLRRHQPTPQTTAEEGFRFIGTGVSGGEEGALKGPSIMPGGHPEAWPFVKDVFQKISAKVGPNQRHSLLRMGRRSRGRALCEDGAQRHRIRRHAADLRSLLHPEVRRGPDERRTVQVFKEWNEANLRAT